MLSITPSVTSPISLRMASESGSPYLAPDLGLSPQNSLCRRKTAGDKMLTNQSRSSTVKHGRVRTIYQVLHLLLQPRHGLLGAYGKHERVHVLVIQSHFDLLQNDRQFQVTNIC